MLILGKCGWVDPNKNSARMMAACEHGTKYEPVVQSLYELKEGCKLLEFGSLNHPNHSMISASPDGITTTGMMLEIKVPLNRNITGIVPPYYWVQMQQQMAVCDLDAVDFVECQIEEYNSREAYKSDYLDNKPDQPFSSNSLHKGVLIVYIDIIHDTKGYIYPDHFINTSDISEFVSKTKKELQNDENKMFACERYWKLQKYNKIRIWRDREWWDDNYKKYYDFWEKVEYHRKNGHDDLIPIKKPRQKKETICLIESDKESLS